MAFGFTCMETKQVQAKKAELLDRASSNLICKNEETLSRSLLCEEEKIYEVMDIIS